MSFRCENCDEPQPPGTRPVTLVVGIHLFRRKGWQILRQIKACRPCSKRVTHWTPETAREAWWQRYGKGAA